MSNDRPSGILNLSSKLSISLSFRVNLLLPGTHIRYTADSFSPPGGVLWITEQAYRFEWEYCNSAGIYVQCFW